MKMYRLLSSIKGNRPLDAISRSGENCIVDDFVTGGWWHFYHHNDKKYKASVAKAGIKNKTWETPDLVCSEKKKKNPTDWDCFELFDAVGILISQRAVDAIGPYLEECFELYPASFEKEQYFAVCFRKRIDCLDRKNSRICEHSGTTKSATFFSEKIDDPKIFATPDDPTFYWCTGSIAEIIKANKLKGFAFYPSSDTSK
ncbi:hypothetical protein N9Y42_05590 [Mariniblastus sp.]|nr:hypothetical protein [Mariniblastus sp.]